MAGAAGFEPANAGIKSRCLTAWRRPKIRDPFNEILSLSQISTRYKLSHMGLILYKKWIELIRK